MRALPGVVVGILLAGCLGEPVEADPLGWHVLRSGPESVASHAPLADDVAAEIFSSPEAFNASWGLGNRPLLDFGNSIALKLGWGPAGVGGGLRVERIEQDVDHLHVHAVLEEPGPHCVSGTLAVQHVTWLLVEATGLERADVVAQNGTTEPCPQRPARAYHVMSVTGELSQEPPEETVVSCGRPANAFAALDIDERRPYLVQGHDFDWEQSWLMVFEDVQQVNDYSSCDISWLSSYEDPYSWNYGAVQIVIEELDGVLYVAGRAMTNDTWTLHVDEMRDGRRYVGEVTFRSLGSWQVQDIVVVPSESLVIGDLGGFWR